jgi:hypothetical protein
MRLPLALLGALDTGEPILLAHASKSFDTEE